MASPQQVTRIRTQLFILAADPDDLDRWLTQHFGVPIVGIDRQTAAGLILIFNRFLFDREAFG